MTRLEFDIAQAHHLSNKKTKKGIELFEKYIGRIAWLHPEEQFCKVRSDKKYVVINLSGEVVFEANRIGEIAKQFCVSDSRVSACVNSTTLMCGKYLVERCENE